MLLTPAEWEREGSHSASGRYSVDDWLRIYADHSHDHAEQIAAARTSAPAVAGAGASS